MKKFEGYIIERGRGKISFNGDDGLALVVCDIRLVSLGDRDLFGMRLYVISVYAT